MILHLDSIGPLYQQLARAIEKAIESGQSIGGGRLPSTRDLALGLHISRNTVRAAYDLLVAKGVVSGRHGSGSFVVSAPGRARGKTHSDYVPAPSRYAQRVRDFGSLSLGPVYPGLRYNLQYCEPVANIKFLDHWKREVSLACSYTSPGYPPYQGLPALRAEICSYLKRRRGLDAAPEDVLVVSGTQQALSIASRVLVDPGATVVMEDPGYFAARATFQVNGAMLAHVPVDDEGLMVDMLPVESPAAVYVTPAHQFPLGLRMSHDRRRALLDYAHKHKSWVIEDDYDAALGMEPESAPPLFALDTRGCVVHIGTFSKSLAPALRLGYMVLPRALRNDFVLAKRVEDLSCSSITQAALAGFIRNGGYERHLRLVARALQDRRARLLRGIRLHLPHVLRVDHPGAGMHMVAWFDESHGVALPDFIHAAARMQIGLHALGPHFSSEEPTPALLLGFAGLSPTEIDSACRLLGECFKGLQRRVA